jgi:hypothetical protein
VPQAGSGVEVVGQSEPFFQVGVDLGVRGELDVVSYAVFLGQAAGVDETRRELALLGGEAGAAKIDAGIGGALDLGKDVVAIERNYRFAGASFGVGAEGFGEGEKIVRDGTEYRFFHGVLFFDVTRGRGEIFFGTVCFPALAVDRFRGPPGRVAPNLCLDFSQARRDGSSFGPSFMARATHSVRARPVSGLRSAIHFCTMATPG